MGVFAVQDARGGLVQAVQHTCVPRLEEIIQSDPEDGIQGLHAAPPADPTHVKAVAVREKGGQEAEVVQAGF